MKDIFNCLQNEQEGKWPRCQMLASHKSENEVSIFYVFMLSNCNVEGYTIKIETMFV